MARICSWLLVVCLSNISIETVGQAPPLDLRYVSYEVTIPKKLRPRHEQEESWDLTYFLQINRKGYTVHLRRKSGFIFEPFPIFTYSMDGQLQVDHPFIKNDCFYHGFIQGKPSSLVILNTCSGGLRGLFQLENKTYEIEPVQASVVFQHVLYQLEEKENSAKLKCGVTAEKKSRQEAMIQITEKLMFKVSSGGGWWTHIRYAKIAIVIENELYIGFQKNETLVAQRVLDVIHAANLLYAPLGIRVALVGLEIWSEKNFITFTDNLEFALEDFNHWRKNILAPRLGHDASHIFVNKTFPGKAGLAYVGGICDPEHASGIELDTGSKVSSFAFVFIHELGHNLGMVHDKRYCTCYLPNCIMAEHHTHAYRFSNCSYISYYRLMTLGNTECLRIPPEHDQLFRLKSCGNKVVENGEQCDCGSKFQCKSDKCCQSNCMFRPGGTCAFGQCCGNCKYLPVATVCRKRTNACDLPEYCNGTSEWCPEDVYVQDGTPCSDDAYCYHGNCTSTHTKQCKMIFGKEATVASEDCFREVNSHGDRFGNCGINNGTEYKGCKKESVLCGRIQCEDVYSIPLLEDHHTIVQTHISNRECWGTDYHSGLKIADIGAVIDGTPCGKDMMCISGQCMNVSFLNYDCYASKCLNRGVCNNRKHCHCDYGWSPPDCLNKGYGGSIDSGPAPPRKKSKPGTRTKNIIVVIFAISAASCCAALCINFINILRCHFTKPGPIIHPAEPVQERTQSSTEVVNA
ncbi:disintegrin and metalloproteinase domain-containing protein 21 [Anolis carolinensis]|uniref:ADAM metallopeptidase domain 20 n=1 Tax=Anolis carolinensis TaxID=28377 RepID=A0A803U004_ANOCA|nr:PREDICTED: disintegrin and metalloproteinase domain-containing protein 21 [Anolis carolinensis]|eukprot:XP_016853749.1 PREDICTED: disintegrin and metalloproteinase domain-containing protein 21 [Anolis carolinensis]